MFSFLPLQDDINDDDNDNGSAAESLGNLGIRRSISAEVGTAHQSFLTKENPSSSYYNIYSPTTTTTTTTTPLLRKRVRSLPQSLFDYFSLMASSELAAVDSSHRDNIRSSSAAAAEKDDDIEDIAATTTLDYGTAGATLDIEEIVVGAESEQDSTAESNSILAGETILIGQEEEASEASLNQEEATTNSTMTSSLTTHLTPLTNRLLTQTTLSDKLLTPYPLLLFLSQHNGKYYSFLLFFATNLLFFLLLWMPLWILAQIITEVGVYLFLLTSLVYGGRCLLRLLAFPGTNVKVYGEIENEFAKYSCKMLEGAAGSLEDFAKSLRAGASVSPSSNSAGGHHTSKANKLLGETTDDDNDGWDIVDVPATYKRMVVFKKRVLGVYLEVLHCLLEENGQGYDPFLPHMDTMSGATNSNSNSSNGGGRNGFYRLGCDNITACRDTCKRNLCCDKRSNNNNNNSSSNSDRLSSGRDIEGGGIQLEIQRSTTPHHSGNSAASFDGAQAAQLRPSSSLNSTTCYGNNPLVGDIGNMGNLTTQARADGRELYELLTSTLRDLCTLESSAGNVLRSMENREQLKQSIISEEIVEHATQLILRAGALREFVGRIKLPTGECDNNNNSGGDDNSSEQQHNQQTQTDEESEVNAEAVRHRLEEQGTASSSSSTMGMVWSAIQAFMAMIDPPPHKSIFGLDVIRGCFLARYVGARQFWVMRDGSRSGSGGCMGGDGKLDVILVPSSSSNNNSAATSNNTDGEAKDSSLESFLPLSPRKGRAGVAEDLLANRTTSNGGVGGTNRKKRKAVLYCNPNAGLVEVATGMGLTGGNVDEDEDDEEKEPTCWTEYYIEHGYDVYLFNYAGYGRSYGGSSWNDTSSSEFSHGFLGALKRVLFSTFLAFKPSSESLKADAAAVAKHLVDVVGVEELVIHGESIGGMAAAGAARALTATTISSKTITSQSPSTVLICDRTFCNLEAVAQRLVGQWTGNAIRLLTPAWSTDVARDFLAARCPKIVAQDCADEIIHDYSSLKSGLSFAGELTRGSTANVGWTMSPPLEYRVDDLDNVGAMNSRLGSGSSVIKNPPTWPADKHISWTEAHHFAACVRRIGKLATLAKKRIQEENKRIGEDSGGSGLTNDSDAEEAGIEVSLLSSGNESSTTQLMAAANNAQKKANGKALIKLWNKLLLTDGLCGYHLGHAVKEGSDCTIAWLCCAVVYGSQVLAEKAEKRWGRKSPESSAGSDNITSDDDGRAFLPEDFDLRPPGYHWDEDDLAKHALPIPEVVSLLKEIRAQENVLKKVEAELAYVIGMLEYIVLRLCSKENIAISLQRRNGCEDEQGVISTGCFLNLHCGHNNQYSSEEREKLIALIRRACGDSV